MEDFFIGVLTLILAIVIATGLVSIFIYIPDSHYISSGTCCVCGEQKNKTCNYKEIIKGNGSKTVISYTLCEDCVIDFCKKVKKEEPKEEKRDEK